MRDPNPFVECYRFRSLFYGLVRRDVVLRYRGSILGIAWAFVSPAIQLAVYTLVFAWIMRIGIANYPVFVLSAFLPWIWFSSSVQMASRSIVSNGPLVRKIYFPSEILPMVAVTSNLVNYLVALPLLLGAILALGMPLSGSLVALPVLLAIQFAFTAGVALVVAALNTFYRDVEHVLALAMTVWLYLTPVLYPTSHLPEGLVPVLAANPMFHLAEGYRAILLAGQWPAPAGLAYAALASLALVLAAGTYFGRRKDYFPEVV